MDARNSFNGPCFIFQGRFPYFLKNSFRFFSRSTCFSVNQRPRLWCFGSGKYFFPRHSCRVEMLIPTRSAACAKEIGASAGVGRVRSPRLYLLLASNPRCRYSGSSAYRFLRFSESRCLFFSYQLRKPDSFFFGISAILKVPPKFFLLEIAGCNLHHPLDLSR
jgi:hypothetical protein